MPSFIGCLETQKVLFVLKLPQSIDNGTLKSIKQSSRYLFNLKRFSNFRVFPDQKAGFRFLSSNGPGFSFPEVLPLPFFRLRPIPKFYFPCFFDGFGPHSRFNIQSRSILTGLAKFDLVRFGTVLFWRTFSWGFQHILWTSAAKYVLKFSRVRLFHLLKLGLYGQ